jgi:glycosyltransferase involved in cell wall biosynthesis
LSLDLHIVSFDVPYPPSYGGVIDVYYKIQAFHELGVRIHLHTFQYGRERSKILDDLCEKVYYYSRKSNLRSLFSRQPLIVKSRSNSNLILRLKKDQFPILFEGLHTTGPLRGNAFSDRMTLVRTHNIEHDYYNGLALSEKNLFKKWFFKFESKKLKKFESILSQSKVILAISPYEQKHFSKYRITEYIPVFHGNSEVVNLSIKGEKILYHGDLRVSDNIRSCEFLIEIFKGLDFTLTIAGACLTPDLAQKVDRQSNVEFVQLESGDQSQLKKLFEITHINILPTFQKTGIKLKLIHALFASRFTLVNIPMIEDTGLESLCTIANDISEFQKEIKRLMDTPYDDQIRLTRIEHLSGFNNLDNAKKIIDLISSL